MSNWSRWYREGTVTLHNGSSTVTGENTYWLNAGLHAGDIFSLDNVKDYEISSVVSNTELTLATAYETSDAYDTEYTGLTYSIIRNFTAGLPSETAAKTSGLIEEFARYIDNDMRTIQGKSAYEVACSSGYIGTQDQWLESLNAYGLAKLNGFSGTLSDWLLSLKGDSAYQVACAGGFTGTQEEWLQSLIGAQEWQTLNSRTRYITESVSSGYHNSHFRGKNLGTSITTEQLAAIKSGTYEDLFVGDYWKFPGIGMNGGDTYGVIAGFNLVTTEASIYNMDPHIVLWFTREHMAGEYLNDGPIDPTTGWVGMKIYTEILPTLLERIETVIPSERIVVSRTYVADAVDSSTMARTHTVTADDRIFMPTYAELRGYEDIGKANGWSARSVYPRHRRQFPLLVHNRGICDRRSGDEHSSYPKYIDVACTTPANFGDSVNSWNDMFGLEHVWDYGLYEGSSYAAKFNIDPYVVIR